MKHAVLGAALAASLSMTVAGDARAESINFGAASCEEFIQTVAASSEDDVASMMLWLDGYPSGVSGDAVLRFDGLAQFGENLVERCGNNPDENLLHAARAVGLE